MPNLSWEKCINLVKEQQRIWKKYLSITKKLLIKNIHKQKFKLKNTCQLIAVKRPFILTMSESSAFLPD